MEKEILNLKKEELVEAKKTIDKNEKEIQKKENENDILTVQNIELTEQLNINDRIVFLYERLQDSKKLLLVAVLMGVVFSLGFGVFSLVDKVNLFSTILSFIGPVTFSSLIGSIPYACTKLNISNNTNLTLEEVTEKIGILKKEKQLNREKFNLNLKEIEKLKQKNDLIEDKLYNETVELLKDKEACEEIMANIFENDPSKKLVEMITEDIVKSSKVKMKR